MAAIIHACMLIHLLHLWKKIWLNAPMIQLSQTDKLHESQKLSAWMLMLFRTLADVDNIGQPAGNIVLLLFLSTRVSLSLIFSLSLSRSHSLARSHHRGTGLPIPVPSVQPGSHMIKAMAGGLHFETINRPVGAESNGQPSISVSPSSCSAQRERGARALRGRPPPLRLGPAWRSVGGTRGPLMWFQAHVGSSVRPPAAVERSRAATEEYYLSPFKRRRSVNSCTVGRFCPN